MKQKSIYRTIQGQAEIHALYDRQLAKLDIVPQSHMVSTRFGKTHVLIAGPEDGVPLVMLHGGNTTNPTTLSWIMPLVSKYRLYAPDTIGHPGKSDPVRLSPRDGSYGQWLADVLDAFSLAQVAIIGGSYGAGILLNLAAYAPQRIRKAVLFVPSGIVSIPFSTLLFGLLAPLVVYRLAPTRARLIRVLQPMFANDAIPDDMLAVTEMVFRHVSIEPEMPRNVVKDELAAFTAPTLVLAAEHDRLFPAHLVLPRVRQLFSGPLAAELIPGSAHFISPAYLPAFNQRVDRFLQNN